jgi:hypothetical protein
MHKDVQWEHVYLDPAHDESRAEGDKIRSMQENSHQVTDNINKFPLTEQRTTILDNRQMYIEVE